MLCHLLVPVLFVRLIFDHADLFLLHQVLVVDTPTYVMVFFIQLEPTIVDKVDLPYTIVLLALDITPVRSFVKNVGVLLAIHQLLLQILLEVLSILVFKDGL